MRAYARKSYLARLAGEPLSHLELLSQINGIDISPYAAHIATVNLASRSLEDEANYPRVAVHDFFDATPHKALIHLPVVGGSERRKRAYPNQPLPNTALGHVDAVIGNPPYIRQEEVGDSNKRRCAERARRSPAPMLDPSGRSDIYIYFWPHAASFLRNGGRIALLTSSNWLDTEYGAALQEWMLANFRIAAVLESSVEPWFTGARVATAVTVLERETDEAARNANMVRFVQIRRPLAEVFNGAASEDGRLRHVERFVRDIVEADANFLTRDYRMRRVAQSDLAAPAILEAGERRSAALFIGPKWGVYLRGPNLLFDFLDRYGAALVPLCEVADVRRGITSGADDFFFVRDVTEERLRDPSLDFRDTFGIRPELTDRVRVIESGDGQNHLVEARFLVPEIHRLAEADSIEIDPSAMPRRMVALSGPVEQLPKHAARYVRWGRQKPRQFHKRSTCAGRDPWYDITGFDTPTILWSKAHKYRHLAPYNPSLILPNCNLYGVEPREGVDDLLLCAILNSTIVGWMKCFFSRPMGTEGFKTEVVDVNRLPVPDPRRATPEIRARILDAFDRVRRRKTLHLVDELALKDRQDLDDAVLEMMLQQGAHVRECVREDLYEATRELYTSLRHVEVQATRNRTRTARRARITPHDIAMEIWDGMDRSWLRRFPSGFIPDGPVEGEEIHLPSHVTYVEVGTSLFTVEPSQAGRQSPNGGQALAAGSIRINDEARELGSIERAEYLDALIRARRTGVVEVPLDAAVCRAAVSEFRAYRETLNAQVRELAQEHVGAGRLGEQVAAELESVCLQGYGGRGTGGVPLHEEDAAEDEDQDRLD